MNTNSLDKANPLNFIFPLIQRKKMVIRQELPLSIVLKSWKVLLRKTKKHRVNKMFPSTSLLYITPFLVLPEIHICLLSNTFIL